MYLPLFPCCRLVDADHFIAEASDLIGSGDRIRLTTENKEEIDVMDFANVSTVMTQVFDNPRILLFSDRRLGLDCERGERSNKYGYTN